MINFSDRENLPKMLEIEESSLSSTLNIQKNLNKQILIFMKNFIGNIEVSNNIDTNSESLKYITKATTTLNKSNANIEAIRKLLAHLKKLEKICSSKKDTKLENEILKYNSKFSSNLNSVYANTKLIEEFIQDISSININDLLKDLILEDDIYSTPAVQLTSQISGNTINSDELNSKYIENTLVISDIQKKVILPYKLSDLQDLLQKNPAAYSSLEDVINKVYTLPLNYYNVSSMSRFKEAYKLVIEKAHGSKIKAISLASELFFNYNLHPAIITACSSLDELDIYLACLEDGTLEDFKFFDIKFEIAPSPVKETVKIKN